MFYSGGAYLFHIFHAPGPAPLLDNDKRDGAEAKGQYTGAINSEYRSGQLAGLFVDKKEVTHNTIEGMNREQLEKRLEELERKIGEGVNIIDITPKKE